MHIAQAFFLYFPGQQNNLDCWNFNIPFVLLSPILHICYVQCAFNEAPLFIEAEEEEENNLYNVWILIWDIFPLFRIRLNVKQHHSVLIKFWCGWLWWGGVKGGGVLKQNVDERLFLPLICLIGLRGCFLQNICCCWENYLTRQWLNFDFLSCFSIDWRSKTYFSNICWALGKIIWWVNNLTLVPSCFCIGWRGQSSSEWCAQGHMDRCLVIMMMLMMLMMMLMLTKDPFEAPDNKLKHPG